MKTAGLVLDFYDDVKGEILKANFPTIGDLPEAVKTAHILNPEERQVLRDEAYALVLHNNGAQLRKFACVDPGNTVLSTIYFLENYEKLPTEAIKVAAQNLLAFNDEFGLPVPTELRLAAETGMSTKVAAKQILDAPQSGMARRRDSYRQPTVGDEADWAQRTNLLSIRGGADSGRVIPTVNQMKTAGVGGVDVALDSWMGNGGPKRLLKGVAKGGALAGAAYLGAKKGAKAGEKEKASGVSEEKLWQAAARSPGSQGPLEARAMAKAKGRQNAVFAAKGKPMGIPSAQQMRSLSRPVFGKVANVVDVSGQSPEFREEEKVAEVTALGGRYRLDSYSDVTDAIHFFNDYWTGMPPADRHEFCVKTAARAEKLGIEVPDLMARYGATEYAPDVEAHLANRRQVAPEHAEVYDVLQEKRASVGPEVFAKMLAEADEATGLAFEWGGPVCDPWLATFGHRHEKLAEPAFEVRGERVTASQLAGISPELMGETFTPDVAEAFAADPIAIFKSMPDEQKVIIARLATGV